MIINSYMFGPSYDPDAQAFITAASLTDNTQKNAINTLVINCKAAGIWTKMKAIYPMVGGTASTHKWNLKNPADTNVAFRLVFSGGWTHSSAGATPNGTNAYANTFLNSATHLSLNSGHMSYYSRTNNSAASLRIDMGSLKSGPDSYTDLDLGNSGGLYFRFNNGTAYNFVSATDTSGFFNGNRTASNVINIFRNGTKAVTGTAPSNATSSTNYFIGASNNHGGGSTDTPQYFSNRECAFASIGDGLTDTEALVFNQIVEGYQYELGRNVNPFNPNYYNTAYNNETNAFLYASQITDNTQKSAVNSLVNDLKTAGVWTKMKAVYPLVGGTASTHKWNLVNPQDTNAAYRLTFTGGWTHSSNGALPNGTNGYADTFLNANTALQQFSHHHAFYHNTDNSGTGLRSMGGAQSVSSSNFRTTIETSGTTLTFRDLGLTNAESPVTANTLRGFRASSRTANNNMFIVKADGTTTTSTTSTATNALPSLNCYLAAHNSSGAGANYAIMSIAFHSLGDGLSAAEGLSLRNAVLTFNTTLSRL
jgi:hypothetical protein